MNIVLKYNQKQYRDQYVGKSEALQSVRNIQERSTSQVLHVL